MIPPQQGDEAGHTAMAARLKSSSTPPGHKSDATPVERTHAKEDNDYTSATPLQTPSLTCNSSSSFCEERFESTYVEDYIFVNDIYRRTRDWGI